MAGSGTTAGKTILLVEDEEALRTLLQIVLSQNGYRILEAEDGEKALKIATQHPGNIDLLLTDALLPHMNGYELARRLRPEHPEMRVVYISGYLQGDLVDMCRSDPGCLFLQKPFTPAELVAKVGLAISPERAAGGGKS